MDEIHISAFTMSIIGGAVGLLISMLAWFLSRLVSQLDRIASEVVTLNETMKKIDKDLSGDVGLLKAENKELREKVNDLDPLWERMRSVESDVIAIKNGGCSAIRKGCYGG